jgi:predicted AlkP superfamily phosphohydrolase/phosphomutase
VTKKSGAPVLAIGIEAAETRLVRRLIDQNQMPVLKSLLEQGKWIGVESSANIGTSSVWPCFMTGEDVDVHGIYSEWCWEPATMSFSTLTGDKLRPFWKAFSDEGYSVGILGVPFMPFVGLSKSFEVSDCKPFLPAENGQPIANLITREMVAEALSHGLISVAGPEDFNHLQELAADSMVGIKLRGNLAERLLKETKPDISIVVFTETHESGHCLWQTIEPEHPLFHDDVFDKFREIKPTLQEIYQEVDSQIGKLISAVGAQATVLIFALHGMSPARGVPTFLPSLMCDRGFSRLATLQNQSWTDRAVHLLANAKRVTPAGLKKIYYRAVPRSTVLRWASPTILPQYDWSQTRAFSLVTEQHGSIRVNLIGREAQGIVPLEDYEKICREVEEWLYTLRTKEGKPLTREVIRTATSPTKALTQRIPDVLAHWEDAAFVSPLRIEGSESEFYPDGLRYLSQHTPEGFCILKGKDYVEPADTLAAKELGELIKRIVLKASPTEAQEINP